MTPRQLLRGLAGGAVTLLLLAGVMTLSRWPNWQSVPENAGVIRLSLRHSGARACRPATEAELARLPPNMRRKEICARRRPPVRVELELDGKPVLAREVPPSGLWGTGPSRLYARFVMPAGRHEIRLRMADDPLREDFDWTLERSVQLAPGENLAIGFDAQHGGFMLYEGRNEDG